MPAVAVIRKRLVLFIFTRFKGYLDGKNRLFYRQARYDYTRVIYKEVSIYGVGELKFVHTIRTGKGESNLLSNN